ncbi:MAG TPA: NAD(P)H-hydrate epimerase, partial [Pyrinomonadaceae bacterium]
MREIDRLTTERHGIPSLELMEKAARATFRVVTGLLGNPSEKRILVICGKGNNGGDGAATARMLAEAGAWVDVVLFGKVEETKGDALTNFQSLLNWKSAHSADVPSNTPGTIGFVECNSDQAWSQFISSGTGASPEV